VNERRQQQKTKSLLPTNYSSLLSFPFFSSIRLLTHLSNEKKARKKRKRMNIVRVSKVEQVCHCMFVDDIDKQLNYISKTDFCLLTYIIERDRSIGSVSIINNSSILAQQLANVTNAKRTEPSPSNRMCMCVCVLLHRNTHKLDYFFSLSFLPFDIKFSRIMKS
jgi:hypothetical protein